MADINGTEEEQIAAIKQWLREYGAYIIAGLFLGVASIWGWKFWQDHQLAIAQGASERYEQLAERMDNADLAELQADVDSFLEEQKKSPYATHVALEAAQKAAEEDNMQSASQYLNWVLNDSKDGNLKHVARLRLARIQFYYGNDADKALKTLDVNQTDSFEPLYEELRGDIYRNQNQTDKARAAYQNALQEWDDSMGSTELLQMKLDDLAAGQTALSGTE